MTSRWVSLLAFIAGVSFIGLFIGSLTTPGEWYGALAKPSFQPPAWVFAPVWTVLYVLIAIAGWRIFVTARKSLAMVFWAVQMGLNWLWSPVFFRAHDPQAALMVLVALFLSILAFMFFAFRQDRTAFWLFAPYLLWVSFAALLNASIVQLN